MTALTIGSSVIRQNGNLYCLNDLHKASGGDSSKRPGYFIGNDQTKALIAEISSAGIPAVHTINGGPERGTYACRELVIAYAAWISPAFHLKVIRVFLEQVLPTLPALTPEQQQELSNKVRQVVLFNQSNQSDRNRMWLYNHLRVAFRVARWQDIPRECHPAAMALVESKFEASRKFMDFISEARDWFGREVMGGGMPWTPAIQKKLSVELKRRVILPPKVD